MAGAKTKAGQKDGVDIRYSKKSLADALLVLRNYSDGKPDPFKRSLEERPNLKKLKCQISELSDPIPDIDLLLNWAIEMVTGVQARHATTALIFEALKSIALHEGEGVKPSERLSAIKILGQEYGMFDNKAELGSSLTIKKIERVIVDADPTEITDKDS